jgi:hypothetical protein
VLINSSLLLAVVIFEGMSSAILIVIEITQPRKSIDFVMLNVRDEDMNFKAVLDILCSAEEIVNESQT